jgi:hypothetical protein
VRIMIAASNVLFPYVAKAWTVICPHIYFAKDITVKKNGSWWFHIIDEDPSEPDALAYHTEDNDLVFGNILAKTILENAGVVLYKDNTTETVASALFHELCESLLDPTVNGYWQADNGTYYCSEICDPVQDVIVPIVATVPIKWTDTTNTTNATTKITVGLSDFVYPTWRDTQAPIKSLFSYMNSIHKPFAITPGGYAVIMNPSINNGQPQQIFGEKVAEWKKIHRSRTRRIRIRKHGKKIDSHPK